ncbi:MAG TPA: DUF4430 domain-containing protein [Xanthobacteraceae bacterium]|jgi:hypothetical protein
MLKLKRRAVVLAATILLFVAARAGGPAAGENAAPSVRLFIDYGDGVTKTIEDLSWSKGNTVLDAMKAATSRPHGISFTYTGSGATAVLAKIDDVQNEGAGKKNWQFWVDNAYGDKSFAVFETQEGDVISWRFTTEQGK